MIPIIIPIPTGGGKDPVCPRCGKPEDKKTICGNCGYKYPEEGGGCLCMMILVPIIAVLCVWIGLTFCQWLSPYGDNPSLEQVLRNQWEWVQSKTLTDNQKKARVERAWIAMMTEQAVEMEQYEPNDGDEPRYQRMYKILLPMATGTWNEPNKCYTIRENRVEECR